MENRQEHDVSDKISQLTRWLESDGHSTNLSAEQHRLWLLHKLNPENIPPVSAAFMLPVTAGKDQIVVRLRRLIEKHGSIGGRFIEIAGHPLAINTSPSRRDRDSFAPDDSA
jgi:hypothetical protein